MPVVNPGIRRFLGSAIQRLFNSAAFALPLTHTAVPTRGSITPSFTRATTETGQKWDEAGYLDFTALAGEMVFKGARREYNQVSTKSADNTVGSIISANVTAATTTLTMTAANGSYWYKNSNGNAAIGRVYQCSADVSSTVNRTLCLRALATSGTNSDVQNVAITSTVQRVKLKFTADIVGVVLFGVENRVAYATDTSTTGVITFTNVQISDITGETDQTTIRPYVSVGVESAPAYHGSMVDGVKCYDTDRSGNPISTSGSYPIVGYVPWEARTNLCLQSNAFTTTWVNGGLASITQNAVGPDGATSAWTLTDSTVIGAPYITQGITLTAASYTQSIFVKKTTTATTYPVALVFLAATTGLAGVTIDTNNGVATAWTGYTGFTGITGSASCVSHDANYWRVSLTFTGTAAAWTLRLYPAGTSNATQSTGTLDSAAQGSAVFYGAQVELGSFATPYIPTTTVAVARNASVLTYTGADVANIKTLACTFSRGVGVSNVGYIAALSDGTTANYAATDLTSATSRRFDGVTATVAQWTQVISAAYTPGVTAKHTWSMATNDIKMDADGTAQTQDTVATVPAVTQLNVGHIAGTLVFNGPVNHIYGWTRNFSQSELGAVDRA